MRKNSYGKKLKRGSPANKCAFKYKGKFYTYYSLVKGFSHSHTHAHPSQIVGPHVAASRYFRLTADHHIFILRSFFICFFFNFYMSLHKIKPVTFPPSLTRFVLLIRSSWERNYNSEIASQNKNSHSFCTFDLLEILSEKTVWNSIFISRVSSAVDVLCMLRFDEKTLCNVSIFFLS